MLTKGGVNMCGILCFGGCLAGCAGMCALDTVVPIADVFGATLVNASATTMSVSACDAA
jgi:hypothetical protein